MTTNPDETPRIGAVEEPSLPNTPEAVENSASYQAIQTRLDESARAAVANDRRSLYHLEQELTGILTEIANANNILGLIVASDDGLVIGKNEGYEREQVLSAFAALCDGVATRAVREGLLKSVDEITLRSETGARVTIRGFDCGDQAFLLIATTRTQAASRFVTDEALAKCRELLNGFYGVHDPGEFGGIATTRTSLWRHIVNRALAPLRNTPFFE